MNAVEEPSEEHEESVDEREASDRAADDAAGDEGLRASLLAWSREAQWLRLQLWMLQLLDTFAARLIRLAAGYPHYLLTLHGNLAFEARRHAAAARRAEGASALESAHHRRLLETRAARKLRFTERCADLDSGRRFGSQSERQQCYELYHSWKRQDRLTEAAQTTSLEWDEVAAARIKVEAEASKALERAPELAEHTGWRGGLLTAARLRPWGAYAGVGPLLASNMLGALASATPSLASCLLQPARLDEGSLSTGAFTPSLGTRLLAAAPQLAYEAVWARGACVRALNERQAPGDGAMGAAKAVVSALLRRGVLGLCPFCPWWMLLVRAYLDGSLGLLEWPLLQRLLPAAHPMHEARSLSAALWSTSWLGTLAIPLVGAPLPDVDWLELAKIKISCALPGLAIGLPVSWALQAAWEVARQRLVIRLCGSERQLRRKLRRAVTNASVHATVGSASLARVAAQPSGAGAPRLQRQSTMALKLEAASALEPKRLRLQERVLAKSDAALKEHIRKEAGRGAPIWMLYIDRAAPRASLLSLSLLPSLAVLTGRIKIHFSGEMGQDAGGLFRAFFGVMAKELLGPIHGGDGPERTAAGASEAVEEASAVEGLPLPLFLPAEDKGLLPARGQAEAEQAALAEAETITVALPIRCRHADRYVAGVSLSADGRIASVAPTSDAANAGLRVGDALLSVDAGATCAWLMGGRGTQQNRVELGDRGDWPTLFAACSTLHDVLASEHRGYRRDPTSGRLATIVIPWSSDSLVLQVRLKRGPRPHNPLWRMELCAVGRLLALSVVRSTPLDVPFSRCLYKLLLHEPIGARDVARIDPMFAEHRVSAVLREGGVAATEDLLCEELTFLSVPRGTEEEGEELLPGGASLRVTEANKREYVSLLVEQFLIGFCREELSVLVRGFHEILEPAVLADRGAEAPRGAQVHGWQVARTQDGLNYYTNERTGESTLRRPAALDEASTPPAASAHSTLSAMDLELIVGGLPSIDVADWKAHTVWHDGKQVLKPTAHVHLRERFWECVEGLSLEERAKLLSFACGSGRLPATGFAALKPEFNVMVECTPADNLPSAHTCANQLCMPASYVASATPRVTCRLSTSATGVELQLGLRSVAGASVLEERLRRAISLEAEAGFGIA